MSVAGQDAQAEPRTSRARARTPLAACRVSLLAVWTFYCFTSYLTLRFFSPSRKAKLARSYTWTHRWFAGGARVLGIKVNTRGALPPERALIAPNHMGYGDIIALGSIAKLFFVAKTEVGTWPVIGLLFRSSEQIAVSRKGPVGVDKANQQISDRLDFGYRVCVFLEGTSTGGDRMLKFRSSLVQPAVDAGAPVVPVAITWHASDPEISIADDVAYWKDHVFVAHFWRLAGLRGVSVDIEFGKPRETAGADRKGLAEQLHGDVVQMRERLSS